MPSGLVALLDDVAAIAKLAAASLDDVAGAAGKAGSKAVGVVVDDTAVTPRYAVGFSPERELPIVLKIAVGSLRNKFVFLLPGALALSALAPWAVTPILMFGGTYLSYEATEKILEALTGGHEADAFAELAQSSAEVEAEKVAGAIRTDLILSAEIMAIALATVADRPLAIQAAALALVGLALTVGVYGAVGLIVKMDDIGLHLAGRKGRLRQALGRGLVRGMPAALSGLTVVGTAAMLWVGGGIFVHGLARFGLGPVPGLIERAAHVAAAVPWIGAITGWTTTAVGSSLVGLMLGAVVVLALKLRPRRKG